MVSGSAATAPSDPRARRTAKAKLMHLIEVPPRAWRPIVWRDDRRTVRRPPPVRATRARSGKEAALPSPPPLRTARAPFDASSSSMKQRVVKHAAPASSACLVWAALPSYTPYGRKPRPPRSRYAARLRDTTTKRVVLFGAEAPPTLAKRGGVGDNREGGHSARPPGCPARILWTEACRLMSQLAGRLADSFPATPSHRTSVRCTSSPCSWHSAS